MTLCLIAREPAKWLVCFVPPMESQWWHRYLRSRFKHCFALKRERENEWLLFEPWWTRILIATINDEEAERFLAWGRRGTILQVEERIPGNSSQFRGMMSCAALIAHMLGRNCFVYTPVQLFRRLSKEIDTEVYK